MHISTTGMPSGSFSLGGTWTTPSLARLVPDSAPVTSLEAGGIAEIAKKLNPAIKVIARAHSHEEVQHLVAHGADKVIMGEEEIARQLVLAA